MSRGRKPIEAASGSYTPAFHAVLDSRAYVDASDRAKVLLLDAMRQHTGRNNGHIQLSVRWLKSRGWTSVGQIQKAKVELLERHLIIKTRLGGLNIGPDRFALTWLPISDFTGLEILKNAYHPGAWRFLDQVPVPRKHNSSSTVRNRPVPPRRTEHSPSVPTHGTKTPVFGTSPVPPHGNNELLPVPGCERRLRVVGAPGRSGIPKPAMAPTEIREGTHD